MSSHGFNAAVVRLQKHFAEKLSVEVPTPVAQEAVAKVHGQKNWNTLVASARQNGRALPAPVATEAPSWMNGALFSPDELLPVPEAVQRHLDLGGVVVHFSPSGSGLDFLQKDRPAASATFRLYSTDTAPTWASFLSPDDSAELLADKLFAACPNLDSYSREDREAARRFLVGQRGDFLEDELESLRMFRHAVRSRCLRAELDYGFSSALPARKLLDAIAGEIYPLTSGVFHDVMNPGGDRSRFQMRTAIERGRVVEVLGFPLSKRVTRVVFAILACELAHYLSETNAAGAIIVTGSDHLPTLRRALPPNAEIHCY